MARALDPRTDDQFVEGQRIKSVDELSQLGVSDYPILLTKLH